MRLRVPRFQNAHVVVVGDVMLDRYWHGDSSRISPEAPVPVVRVEGHEDRPGGAANVAVNVAALGADAHLLGLVGRDEAAAALRTRLDGCSVRHDLLVAGEAPTVQKLRIISRNHQMIRLDREDRFAPEHAEALRLAAQAALGGASAVVLSDYAKGSLADPWSLIDEARRRGTPVLVDPKGRDFRRYAGATLLTPNLSEFEAVAGAPDGDADLADKARALIGTLGLEALLVTRGKQGMSLVRRAGEALHLPARAKEVFDVTGAGDTVISVVAAALAAGETLEDAVGLANLAAGLVVGRFGTASVTDAELRRAVTREQGSDRGVLSPDELAAAVADARATGERIVFTNGCFDILHAGHVAYLAQARRLGDRLIVALNSDASVRRLKGPERPINGLDDRMAVVAALEAVDWVVGFDDDTPIPLIERLRPDMLVKGGDYGVEGVVGGDVVRAYGGEVRVLAHRPGRSTTATLRRINGIAQSQAS